MEAWQPRWILNAGMANVLLHIGVWLLQAVFNLKNEILNLIQILKFQEVNTNTKLIAVLETFIEERIKFANMARELNRLYDGKILHSVETVEGSALEDLSNPDDEDNVGLKIITLIMSL